jgi:MFS family permease
MAVMMPFAGRIYDRIGARWPAMIGVLISLVGSYMMVGITADTTRPEMVLWTVIRAAGISMAFMPIMTVGLAALPPSIINSGSAISQIAQRVSNALGVAALGALSTVQQAQLYADRSSLLTGTGPNVLPQVQAMQQQGGQAGLLPLWQQMQTQVMAQTYSNIFLVTTIGSVVALILTFFLKRGRPAPGGEREVVEM